MPAPACPLWPGDFVSHARRPRVVITGIGVVSPNGIGRESFARACREGKSGISPLRIDTTGLRSSVAAAAHDFDPTTQMDAVELRRVPRMVPMALTASREAMRQAQLPTRIDDRDLARSIGVSLGTGGGGLAFV